MKKFFTIMLLLVCAFSRAQYEAIILGDGYANGIANGQIIASTGQFAGGVAVMWDVNTLQRTVLHPAGFEYSKGFGVGGGYQAGSAALRGIPHALYWHSSSKEYVDLGAGPLGFGQTAYATDGVQQVGERVMDPMLSGFHAILWNGTAQSAVDLTPGMSGLHFAYGVHAGRQVGVSRHRATMWSGTPGSAISLHPAWAPLGASSEAYGIYGDQQVGAVYATAGGGAALWTGTAESVVILGGAAAYATNGSQQVGYMYTQNSQDQNHAAVWSGTAESLIDLAQFVPGIRYTTARGIDEFGNIVGFGYDNFGPKAILWKPIPEPSTIMMLAVGVAGLLCRRARRNKKSKCRT